MARKERNLASDYFEIGRSLVEILKTKGHVHVGYPTFESYLKSKPQFGRTFYSYLIRLGKAPDLHRHLPQGIGGTQLVEHARATDFPEQIGRLIAETWKDAGQLTVRGLSKALREHVAAHEDIYKKPGRLHEVRRRPPIVTRVAKLLEKLEPEERAQMVAALDELLVPYRLIPEPGLTGQAAASNPSG